MVNHKWRIPAMQGLGFRLAKGQVVRVTDVEGEQVADFAAYRADDTSERLDPSVTLDALRAIKVKPMDIIYSNKYRPLLTVMADTVGKHDFINSACRPEMYELLYNKQHHASCYHNLNTALAPFGIPAPDQHYSLNLFMNTVIHPSGQISIERPLSKPGDYIELRAEMDLIVGISACPCEESACNGYKCTPIDVEIL
ncbi:urea carboxylase-associated family protein [Paenibacillus sediminis]|uniref:Uncharacterized protein YcgI (DUF1989 family) n=1 Tax=Paenibacillus sediminis TaxID=664909 RepID=A0ABS4H551_9BACL|nr:urea carboxylase-associated family protein [Paenibacillus sediminis]MBP1937616.1 uncharacterized protein YcgI (DUF1989 family) [Paenibacillus sediminis]